MELHIYGEPGLGHYYSSNERATEKTVKSNNLGT